MMHVREIDILVRRFCVRDLDRILEIERASFETVDAASETMFLEAHSRWPKLFFVVESSGTVAGYIITCIVMGKGRVASIAIDPLFRYKGIGKALVIFTLQELSRYRVTVVELEVKETNETALTFWRGLGFRYLETIPQFYKDGAAALRLGRFLDRQ